MSNSFMSDSAPHWLGNDSVARMMRLVLLALVPMLLVSLFFFGIGILQNLLLACASCLAFEWLVLRIRRKPSAPLLDGSALVTAMLLTLSIPPLLPWWVTVTACLFAIVFAKHIYGGLGYNVFNPAMVGYVVVLIAFPQYMANWPTLTVDIQRPDLLTALSFLWTGTGAVDAISGATPLDTVKMQLAQMRTMDEIQAGPMFGAFGGFGWDWLNIAALAGGLWLIQKRVISWHVPGSLLATLALLYFANYVLGSATNPSPLLGLLSGGTMLAAFFIATDPVSGAASNAGRIVFGCGVGALCFVLRKWGAYPDGIAFAILLMNMSAPLIDRYSMPRIYGHKDRP